MMQGNVDRYLKDKAMDNIDHALGRPVDPIAPTYRNRFVIDSGSEQAAAFRASPHWEERGSMTGMTCFVVTDAGRAALKAHLREIGDPHRPWSLTFDGHEQTVVAVSRAKARYRHWLDVGDCCPDLSFVDYCRRVTVRSCPF